MINPPLSLYVHLPWCVRKCPYCDFNSHEIKAGSFPEKEYVGAVIRDLEFSAARFHGREIISIFFGGGTPSVMSVDSMGSILEAVDANLALSSHAEITLEANPGTADSQRFTGYRRLGINRISLGVQSFSDDKLTGLGRIHNGSDAVSAIEIAAGAGFSNVNIDLMYGLPGQTVAGALSDLERAVTFEPEHISWYQLTIEPNTVFYAKPPSLPEDDEIWQMQTRGQDYLARRQYRQYEVSAWRRNDRACLRNLNPPIGRPPPYDKNDHACLHNLNYWQFGDYIGIGAGAHGKITDQTATKIVRQSRLRIPASYIDKAGSTSAIAGDKQLTETDLILEFMLNALRLKDGVPWHYFEERTGLSPDSIHKQVEAAKNNGLLADDQEMIKATEKGARYLNDLLQYFMLDKKDNKLNHSRRQDQTPHRRGCDIQGQSTTTNLSWI